MPKPTTRTAARVIAPAVELPKGHFPDDIHERFEIHEWRHASAILRHDFPEEWRHLLEMLRAFRLQKSWIVKGGGNKSELSRWVDGFLGSRGWIEKQFDTAVVVDAIEARSPTHKVDCYRNRIALELEWNNKDPFFDRDLNNFRLLFDLPQSALESFSPAVTSFSRSSIRLAEVPRTAIRLRTCRSSCRGSKAAEEQDVR